MNTSSVGPFRGASRYFVDAVAAVPLERYETRWSDEWRILDLIGHGNRANVLVVEYYERPAPVAGPDYGLPEKIAERARQAVKDLGDDPVAAVRTASDRALAVVAAARDDARVGTPFGERTLDTYLRSRTAELVLHGLDLRTGLEPPPESVAECGAFLMDRAIQSGRGVDVVCALSGRGACRQTSMCTEPVAPQGSSVTAAGVRGIPPGAR
ncbi:MAG TPA: maleylpyruvate isomerase N-terminal domain-containing protein [Acidimicrobiales bacterium]|nr:maleylpyruvate isomerase N-terminal domain-containing protein [Acidimicrobiales bacterium]